jgi:arsenite-transporting ATPase
MQRLSDDALANIPACLATLERETIPLRRTQVIGVDALRSFFSSEQATTYRQTMRSSRDLPPNFDRLIEDLSQQSTGVIMTMGKGGVGKTTIAARIAIELARQGLRVHLTTTDPAAHIATAAQEATDTLTIGEINPAVEVARYRAEVMATTGARLDSAGLALLEEDLSSPCTEEIAVFQAFARTVDAAVNGIVVIDTAPTGHTILLLDAAQSYHREVMRQSKNVTEAVRKLLPRLRDPAFTRIVLCTLAEATPVHEAAALQADLRRAAIEPYAWVINQSLVPLAVTDPVLLARRGQEVRYIDEVTGTYAIRAVMMPWQAEAAGASQRKAFRVAEAVI